MPGFPPMTRREMLARCGIGLGALGLAGLLARPGCSPPSRPDVSPLAPRPPHFPAKAKRVIHLFMNGGPSHVDTFDPKPALHEVRRQGRCRPPTCRTERKTGAAFRSPFKFQKYGQSGIEVSELFAHTAERIDDICVIRSMHADVPEPRAVADADELRRGAADPAEHGVVGDLRPGHREPEPARLRRHVPRRLPDRGDAELAGRRSCPASTRARTSTRSTPTLDKLIENIRNNRVTPRASSGGSSTCCSSSTASTCERRAARRRSSRRASSRSSWPTGCRPRRPTRSTSAGSRSTSASMYGPGVQARQLPDRPAAGRARRALRAGLARRRPAVGRPRRHRGRTTAGWPSECDQADRRACSPT